MESTAVLPSHRPCPVPEEDTSSRRESPRYRARQQDTIDHTSHSTSPRKSSRRLERTARSYLGVPYEFGGTTRRGMDCSGFVYRVYTDLGYDVSRLNSQGWYDHGGRRVSRNSLQVGDLCFFGPSRRINHVGFYVGNDSFIHASSSRGIVITSLDDPYWSARFVGCRRITPEK
ncbi:C40 family peptidase [Chitinivibrio alkaliphilus]|nr:C40 family peptidase [Chitinivibrio alkaliphilus]